MSNSIIIEKIRIKDLWSSLKEIIVGNSSNVDEEKINKRLEEIYYTQSKLGATDSINSLEKEVQMHNTKAKSVRNRRQAKIETEKNDIQINANMVESKDIVEQENNLEL